MMGNIRKRCENQTVRTLLALYRIGGLRPGEAFEATWEDVSWDENWKIRSPKTEHSGKDFRVIPLFKLLRIELVKLYQQARQPKTGAIINAVVANKADVVIRRAVERSGEPV